MYVVVSRWQVAEEDRPEFTKRAKAVGEALRKTSGCIDSHGFYSEESIAVLVMYFQNAEAYENMYVSLDSPFARAIAEHQLDMVAKWLSSERGDVIE
jgi:heme-degrading monooxygenase HmoA